MKRFALLFLAMILVFTGCGKNNDLDVDPVEESSSNVMSVVISSDVEPYTMDIPVYGPWTWNDLYDFLEDPNRSGNLSFDTEKGEWVELLDTDGVTSLKDQWTLPLKQNMVVVKYSATNEVLFRYRINLTGTPPVTATPSTPSPSTPESSKPVTSTPVTSTPNTTPAQKQTLTFYVGQNDSALEKLVAEFNKQSNKYEILPVKTSQTMSADTLSELLANNNAPDLILMNHREMSLAANKGLLTNMTTVGMNQWQNLLDPAFLNKTAIGSTYYGSPLGAITSCLACNADVLYKADVDTVPATWDELIANAKTVRDTLSGITPLGITTDIADTTVMAEEFALFLKAYGGELFSADYSTVTFNSEAGINALTLYKQLKEENLLSSNIVRKDLYNETIAYSVVTSTNYSKTFGSQAKANYTAAPLMGPDNQPAASYMELYSFCGPSSVDKNAQKIIGEFLNFFYQNTQNSVTVCRKKGLVPAHLAAQKDDVYDTEAWKILIDTAKTARLAPTLSCYDTMKAYLAEAVSTVLDGGDVTAALEKAATKAENRLARQ